MIARACTVLPGPGLAEDREHLALLQRVGDPVDGLDDAVLGPELDLEVVDRRAADQPFGSSFTSRASRSDSPSRTNAPINRHRNSDGKNSR